MKIYVFILAQFLAHLAFAQGDGNFAPDSLQSSTSSDQTIDSLRQIQHQAKLESLQQRVSVQRLQDSLHIQTWADSLRQKVDVQARMDSLALQQKIDSLQNLRMPTTKLGRKLDSLRQKRDALKTEIAAKENELQQQTTGRLKKWERDVRTKLKLDSLGLNTSKNLPGVPGLSGQLPSAQMQGLPSLGTELNLDMPGLAEMPALNGHDFTSLNLSPDLSRFTSELDIPGMEGWKEVTDQFGTIGGQVKEVGGMLQSPDKAAESALMKVGEVSDAGKQLGEAEGTLSENEALQLAEKMKDPEALKEEAQKQAAEQAINHFAGKEEGLKKTMGSLSKYKAKVPSLSSLSELPKRWNWPKNGMKGKHWRERTLVGLYVRVVNTKDTLSVGFYPQVAYRLTGRLNVGLGGYYRLREEKKDWTLDRSQPQWGIAGFTTFRVVKSFHWRLEMDAIKTMYPLAATEAPKLAQWRWQPYMGVQNIFKISKSFSASSQILYDFNHRLIHSIPQRLVLRFGVEYKIPKKKVKPVETN